MADDCDDTERRADPAVGTPVLGACVKWAQRRTVASTCWTWAWPRLVTLARPRSPLEAPAQRMEAAEAQLGDLRVKIAQGSSKPRVSGRQGGWNEGRGSHRPTAPTDQGPRRAGPNAPRGPPDYSSRPPAAGLRTPTGQTKARDRLQLPTLPPRLGRRPVSPDPVSRDRPLRKRGGDPTLARAALDLFADPAAGEGPGR